MIGRTSVAGRKRRGKGLQTSCWRSPEVEAGVAADFEDVVEAAGFAVGADDVALDDELIR